MAFIRVTEGATLLFFQAQRTHSLAGIVGIARARKCRAGRLEELYDQSHKADLDKRFLADLKRWRLLIANGFALRNQKRFASQTSPRQPAVARPLIFSRMLETHRLIE